MTLLRTNTGPRQQEYAFDALQSDYDQAGACAQTLINVMLGGGTINYLNKTGIIRNPLTEEEYDAYVRERMLPILKIIALKLAGAK